jgi:ribosome-binding factor A
VALQAAIARQARIKRTPELEFRPDPAVRTGERVERILRDVSREEEP